MTSTPFASRARNAEDVVVWRALGSVEHGRAVEVAPDPDFPPLTALADVGWTVVPITEPTAVAGLEPGDLHVLAGAGDATTVAALTALTGSGLTPWVVVTASGTRPSRSANDPRKPIRAAGYTHCLFDGVNNFYVHESHRDLSDLLSYPACSRDDFTTATARALATELASAEKDAERWRAASIENWAQAAHSLAGQGSAQELEAMRNTLSWRLTKPLRRVRGAMPSGDR